MDNPNQKNSGLVYEIKGQAPVQGNGTIDGREFYFHAKHSNWSFEVANDQGELPSDVGGNHVFFIQSRHNDAGYMSSAEVGKIIEDCCALYLSVTAEKLKTSGN